MKFITLLFFGTTATAFSFTENYVVIRPSAYILELYTDQDVCICSYPIGLGENGLGKTRRGDRKTPIGTYHILWKATSCWEQYGGLPILEGSSYCGTDNSFSPNYRDYLDDGAIWGNDFGGSEIFFMCLNYPNESDLEKGFTGSGIGIHGTLNGGIGEFSSAGCIRMHPHDARNLYGQLSIGSLVYIESD